MADDFNLFDDDSLIPDWMRDPAQQPAEPAADRPPDGQQPPSAAGAPRPVWDLLPGDPASPPERPVAPAPWDLLAGSPPPAPAPLPPSLWQPAPQQSAPDLAAWDADRAPAAPDAEVPRGLTQALPWRAEAQATPPSESVEADWMSAFGATAETGFSSVEPTPSEADDLAWLRDDLAAPTPEPEAAGAPLDLRDLDAAFEATFDLEPTGPAAQAEPSAWSDLDALRATVTDADEADAWPAEPGDADAELAALLGLEAEEAAEPAPEVPAPDAPVPLDWLLEQEPDLEAPGADFAEEAATEEDDFAFDFGEDLGLPAVLVSRAPTPPVEPPPPPKPPVDLPDWLRAAAATSEPGSAPDAEPAAPQPEAVPDWLTGSLQDSAGAPEQAVPEDVAPAESVPDWVVASLQQTEEPGAPDQAAPESAAAPAEDIPDWVRAQIQADAQPPGIRRIAAEPEPAEQELPEWVHEAVSAEEEGPAGPPDDLTYEQWEALQAGPAASAPTPAPAAEIPAAWPEPPELAPEPQAGVPGAPADEEVPEWARGLDLGADALTRQFEAAVPTPPAETAPAELPDWMKGSDTQATAGLDWAALFGGGPAEPAPPTEPAGSRLRRFESAPGEPTAQDRVDLGDLFDEEVPAAAPEPAADRVDLEDLFADKLAAEEPPPVDRVDLDDLFEEEPAPTPEPSSAPGRVTRWLEELVPEEPPEDTDRFATQELPELPLAAEPFAAEELPPPPEELLAPGKVTRWLEELVPEEPPAEAETAAIETALGALPDLDQFSPPEAAPADADAATLEAMFSTLPDLDQFVPPETPQEPEPLAEPAALAPGLVPEWLQSAAPPPSTPDQDAAAFAAAFGDLPEPEMTPAPEEAPYAEQLDAAFDAVFGDFVPPETPQEPEPLAEPAALAPGLVPEWLQSAAPPPSTPDEDAAAFAAAFGDLPELETTPAPEEASYAEQLDAAFDAVFGDFVPPETPEEPEPLVEPEALAPGLVPEWLQSAAPPPSTPDQDAAAFAAAFGELPDMDQFVLPEELPADADVAAFETAFDELPDMDQFVVPEDDTAEAAAAAWQAAFGPLSVPEPSTAEADAAAFEAAFGPLVSPEEAPPTPESGWAIEYPEMDTLISSEPAQVDALPDWMRGTPGDVRVVGPEDIPFPDLALDQTMPLDDRRVPRAPIAPPPKAPVEDFVERFEPLAPDELLAVAPEGLPPEWSPEPPDRWLAERVPPATPSEAELDWLQQISPEDIGAQPVPAQEAALEPALPPGFDFTAPPEEPEPLASLDIDRLLSTSALALPTAEPAAVMEDDLAALFEQLPDDLGLPAESEDRLSALLGEGAPPAEPQFGVAAPDLTALWPDSAAPAPAPEPPAEPQRRRWWSRKATPLPAPPAPEPEPLPSPGPAMPLAPAQQPEWVAELRPTELPVTVKAGGVSVDIKQTPLDQLPEALRTLRDQALAAAQLPQAGRPADSGPLAGISGALPLAEGIVPATVQPRAVAGLIVSPEQSARAARLQTLLEAVAAEEEPREPVRTPETAPRLYDEFADLAPVEEAAPAPQPGAPAAPPRRRARLKPDRVLVALVLLAALIGPFLSESLHLADDPAPLADSRLQAADTVAALAPGDYVLVAFEYGPAAAGELDGLAQAVLRDVLARRAIPLTLSTEPVGAFHAPAVIAPLAEDAALLAARDAQETALQTGRDYYTLGVLAGEAVGVRGLSAEPDNPVGPLLPLPPFQYDLRGEPTGLPVGSLAGDIALVVVIGDETDDVRTWAEQLSDVSVPKIALVTAAIEPLIVPYAQSETYAGYLAGARDTYSYDAARNTRSRTPYAMPADAPDLPNPETARWHSLALGALVAAALISLGLLVNILRVIPRRRRR